MGNVAAAGGWKDLGTLLRCYTQADNDTILAVMSESKKVMEKALSGDFPAKRAIKRATMRANKNPRVS